MGVPVNEIVLGDCLDVMRGWPAESVDVVVTSPPYWNLREYASWGSYEAYLVDVGHWVRELYRMLKPGRHVFWVIYEKYPLGKRRYAPLFADTERLAGEAGFECEISIVWDKRGPGGTLRPAAPMYGSFPRPIGIVKGAFTERVCCWRKPGAHGLTLVERDDSVLTWDEWAAYAHDIWSLRPEVRREHPAPFPLAIPYRCLVLWSKKGDLVLDPFMGYGTTAVAALQLGRRFVGIEKNAEYVALAWDRIRRDAGLFLGMAA